MEVKDLSWNDVMSKRFNSQLLPRSIRGLLIGKSGCGKTTLLLNLLLRPGWLDYNSLQVFGKSLFQPEYRIIKKAFEEKLPKEAIINLFDIQDEVMALNISPAILVEEMANNLDKPADIECKFFETSDDVPDPRDLNSTKKNLMIFDDLQMEKQNKCETYYIRGRHSNVDCFYLAQNYFKLPRQTIRENANFICLFPQDFKNVNTFTTITFQQTCQKKNLENFVRQHGTVHTDLLLLISQVRKRMVSIDLDLTAFTFQRAHIKQHFKNFYLTRHKYIIYIKMDSSLLERIATNTEKTARNTEPKSSFYILLSEKSTQIKTKFRPLIQLDKNKKYEMALVNLETYYSFPNIDASNNNFRYSPDNGTTWVNIDFPEGSYEFTDINECIQRVMKENGHYDSTANDYYITLEPNNNTLKAVLDIAPNYKCDFTTVNSLRTVLGFNAQVYASGYNESENIINIMNVSSLRITSDIISSSYSNGTTDNIIYSFFPNVGPGYKIIEIPVNLVYLPITMHTISAMETKLTDQNGKLTNLRGEELSIRFHIREV